MSKISKALKAKFRLSQIYNVPISSIVWMGDNRFIVVKDGNEITIVG